jgi:hypothetical protein
VQLHSRVCALRSGMTIQQNTAKSGTALEDMR